MRSQRNAPAEAGEHRRHGEADEHEPRLGGREADRLDGEEAHHHDGGVDRVRVEEAADDEAQQPRPSAARGRWWSPAGPNESIASAVRNRLPGRGRSWTRRKIGIAKTANSAADEEEARRGRVAIGIGGRARRAARRRWCRGSRAPRRRPTGGPVSRAARRRAAARRSRSAPPGRRSWRSRTKSRPIPIVHEADEQRSARCAATVKTTKERLAPTGPVAHGAEHRRDDAR